MNVKAFRRRVALLAAATLFSITTTALAGTTDNTNITISSFMFMPMAVTIKAGSSVSWTNKDDEPHTIVSDTGLFRSAAIDTDETFTYKFERVGTYHYTCSIHPRMVGTIVVQ